MPIIIANPPNPLGSPTAWQSFANMPFSNRTYGGSGILGDGRIIYESSVGGNGVGLLDTNTLTWSVGTAVPGGSGAHRRRGVSMPDGNYYTGAGINSANQKLIKYDYQTDTWVTLSDIPAIGARNWGFTMVDGGSDNIFLLGGSTDAGVNSTLLKYDTVLDTWTNLAISNPIPVPMEGLDAVLLDNGLIFFGGGFAAGNSASVKYYTLNPNTLVYTAVADFPNANSGYGFCNKLQNGNLLVTNTSAIVGSSSVLSYEYIVNTNTWVQRTDMPFNVPWNGEAFAEVLNNGIVIYGTQFGSWISTASL